MNINDFINELKKINIEINDNQLKQLNRYYELLVEYNEKMNLTGITEKNQVYLKHFYDSLTINKIIDLNTIQTLCDVGTGAGFPGMVIKILFPKIKITLVDSLNKRIKFLNEIIDKLSLKNIETVHSRAEDFAKENRETYDVATSRAVAALNVLLEYLLPLVKVGGLCICMKGSNVQEEIEASSNALKILGGQIEKVEQITLPDSDIIRNIVIVRKVTKTSSKYPRKAGLPSKEPL